MGFFFSLGIVNLAFGIFFFFCFFQKRKIITIAFAFESFEILCNILSLYRLGDQKWSFFFSM